MDGKLGKQNGWEKKPENFMKNGVDKLGGINLVENDQLMINICGVMWTLKKLNAKEYTGEKS